MAKSQIQSDMDIQSFLLDATKLNVSELERITRELNALIVRKKTPQSDQRERRLIQLINQAALNTEQRTRYAALSEKLQNASITEAEHQEFMALVELDEQLRNDRVKYLLELAQLRNIPLPKLLTDLGLEPAHG